MLLSDKTVAIVGGGPGGLTLARLLHLNGANIRVYERDVNRDVRVQGATLDLHEESGLAALRQAGLMDAFRRSYRPGADRLCVVDKSARILYDDPDDSVGWNRPEIDRGPLRTLLLDSLPAGTVVWDSHLVGLAPAGDGWLLQFQNETSAGADLVVAADGANSKIRPLITPIRPFYSGITIVEGNVYQAETAAPRIHALLRGGKIFAVDDEKTLIVSAKGDGSLTFYTGCRTDEDWYRTSGIDFRDRGAALNWFTQTFAGWDTIWQELFGQEGATFIPRPQYCMPFDQDWPAQPNLTMLGDAAHLMPPYAGEGVNMAMQDALELSQCLTNPAFSDGLTAISAYEKQMRRRASEIARMTMQQTESLHAPGGAANLIALFTP